MAEMALRFSASLLPLGSNQEGRQRIELAPPSMRYHTKQLEQASGIALMGSPCDPDPHQPQQPRFHQKVVSDTEGR